MTQGFISFGDIAKDKKQKKPPTYKWQELALKVIQDLNIPPFKKSSVFKVCRDNHKEFIERCLNDTKELCTSHDKWRYFLKLTTIKPDKNN